MSNGKIDSAGIQRNPTQSIENSEPACAPHHRFLPSSFVASSALVSLGHSLVSMLGAWPFSQDPQPEWKIMNNHHWITAESGIKSSLKHAIKCSGVLTIVRDCEFAYFIFKRNLCSSGFWGTTVKNWGMKGSDLLGKWPDNHLYLRRILYDIHLWISPFTYPIAPFRGKKLLDITRISIPSRQTRILELQTVGYCKWCWISLTLNTTLHCWVNFISFWWLLKT